jgi:hypothetical protein
MLPKGIFEERSNPHDDAKNQQPNSPLCEFSHMNKLKGSHAEAQRTPRKFNHEEHKGR